MTILLATLGVYGVLNYASQVRQAEIATRMAVGAKPKQIVSMVVTENISVISAGVSAASVLLFILSQFSAKLADILFSSNSPLLAILTLLIIGLIAFIGCYLPLRQFIYRPIIESLKGGH